MKTYLIRCTLTTVLLLMLAPIGMEACPSIGAPTKGEIDVNQSTATIKCDTGYDMVPSNSSILTCLATGQWSDNVPECVIHDCGSLEKPINGGMHLNATTFETWAVFTCETGYELKGLSNALKCTPTGWEPPTEPTCTLWDCKEPVIPANAKLSSGNTIYLSQRTYSCDYGYEMVGTAKVTCTDKGSWSASPPACNTVACPSIAAPTKGDIDVSQSTATIKCDTGYDMVPSNSSILTCLATGQWSDNVPECVVHDCGSDLEAPINGAMSLFNTTFDARAGFESRAGFTCETGYEMKGTNSLICTPTGWEPPTEPTCTLWDCKEPVIPANAKLSSGNTTYPSQRTYSCDDGHEMVGTAEVTCTDKGTWSASPPACNFCPSIGAPTKGEIDVNQSLHGTATINCDTGYDMVPSNSSILTCLATGQWSDNVPECVVHDCGDLEAPINGAMSILKTTYESRAGFYCETGYEMKGHNILKCTPTGWEPPTEPTCTLWDCKEPVIPANAKLSSGNTTYPSERTYSCDDGYEMVGTAEVTCTDKATWSASPPACNYCAQPSAPTDGTFVLDNGQIELNSTVTYSCNTGYDIKGQAQVTCGADKKYSSDTPECIIQDCGDVLPTKVDNGVVIQSGTTFNHTTVYTCDTGYIISKGVSTLTVTCQATKLWDNTSLLACVSVDIQTQVMVTRWATTLWDNTAPACVRVDCKEPVIPANAKLSSGNTTYPSERTYSCDDGYKMFGTAEVTCTDKGTWSASPPVCNSCPSIGAPTKGELDANQSTATIKCETGYDIIPSYSSILTCLATGQWSDNVPECVIHDCGSDLEAPINGALTLYKTTFEARAGFSCQTGYEFKGTIPICTPTGWEPPTEPTCTLWDCKEPVIPANAKLSSGNTTYPSERTYSCDDGYEMFGTAEVTCTDKGTWSASPPACNTVSPYDPYDPGTLKIQLSCVPRCTSLMSSAEVIHLHTVCQDCHGDVSGYTWTLRQCHSYNVEDCNHYLHLFYVVNNSSSILQYDPANPGHQVSDWTHVGMFVKVKLTDGNQGMTYHILRLFDPASPPVPCSVAPTTGISFSTMYSVVCEDVETPEVYNITYSLYNHVSLQVLVYKSGSAKVTEILLAPGYECSENTVNLQMVARIQGHLFYQTEIPVQVKPAAIDDMMKNFNSGNASDTKQDGASVIDQLLEEGNVFAAVQLLESVAEILNHASDGENATQENCTSSQSGTKTERQDRDTLEKLRTQVIKSLAKFNISSFELVSAVSVVFNKLTEKSEELSEEAREIATGIYSNLAESFAQSLVASQEDVTEKMVTNTAGEILQGAGAMIAMYTETFEKETQPSESDTPEETNGTQTTIKTATQNTSKKIEMIEKLLKTVNTVCDALLDRQIQDAKPTVIVTETVQISVQKLSPSKLGGAQIEVESPRDGIQASRVTMPQNLGLSLTSKDYRLRTVVMNKNSYAWTANASQVKTSVISIALMDSDNNLVEVADLEQPVKLSIPAEFNTANAQSLKQIIPVGKKRDSLDMTSDGNSTSKAAALSLPLISNKVTILRFFMPVNLKSIKIHINETSSLNLQDLLQADTYSTQVSAFLEKFGDHMGNDNSSSSIVFFIPSSSFDIESKDAEINLGLSLDMGEIKTMQTLWHLDPDCEGNQDLEKCQGYMETEVSFSIHMMQCLYWDETMQAWSQVGCLISAETSSTSLNCECDHLSSFAGSIFFLPSVINPIQDLALFLTVFENPVVVTTVLIVWMIYVFLLLWARRADMKDEEKEGVVKCAGSSPSDRYGYLVCVVTGWWRHAGTTANVFFYIKGTLGESPRTSLASSFRKCMQSGSEDWFLLTTKYSLGNLLSVTLWHDNSGTSPQWFLNRVLVKDIQRGVSWMFVCNDWLAADRGLLGLTSITIEPISDEQLRFRQKFNFLLQATSNLRNGHIWISVFTRPSGNWFTRVQRLSCCLSILLTTMLSDLMFTGIPTDDPEDQLTAGTFRLSLSQLAIGIWSSIIVFPINFIIIQLFLKSKPKPKHHFVKTDPSTTNPLATEHLATGGSPLPKIPNRTATSLFDQIDEFPIIPSHTSERGGTKRLKDVLSQLDDIPPTLPYHKTQGVNSTQSMGKESTDSITDNEMGIYRQGSASGKNLPWWCIIIAWCLVILVTVVCSYFIMLYGLKYGYTRSAEWLVSFLTGFFHSILIQEPVKAVAMALIIIFVLRRTVQFEDIETQMQEDCDEDFENGVSCQTASHQPYLEPLSSRLLQQIRIRLKLEWLMDITLKDLIIQVVYLTFLLIILNSRKPVTTAYRSALTVRSLFVNSESRMEISKVKTSGDLYTYLHETLVPAMEEVTATGDKRGVTLGSNHHLVGPYRLRQLRVKNDTCTNVRQSTVPEGCAKGYTTSLEDTDNYDISWSHAPLTLNSSSPWVYREPNQLNTMSFPGLLATYPGSGYVVNMSADVKQHHDVFASLEKTGWFDRRTRAVLLEFSLYNPSVDLFNVVVILFEHASIGSVFPTHHIYTTSMFRYMDESEMYVLICEILFLVLSIIFAYIQIVKCRKVGGKTYISDAWNWAELVQIALSFAAVTLFIHRYVIVEEVLSSFKRGQGKTFVNFNPMVASDLAIDYVTACLLSVLILKVLQLLQFHWRMKLISKTLFHVRSPLLNFVFLFFIVIVAFSHSSYLIFQKALSPYRDFRQAIFSNICMLSGNADVNVITENFQVLGNLFLLVFIVFVVYCLVSVYAIIMNVGRIQVIDTERKQRNKFGLNNYIMNRLRLFLGIK